MVFLKQWSFLAGPLLFFLVKVLLEASSFAPAMAVVMGTLAWMLYWWLFSRLPPAVPALLPFVLFSLYSILPATDLAASVGSSTILLFLGVFMISAAIEKWELHQDFAVVFLRYGATSFNRLLLMFILISAVASMWISNTATVLILLPVIEFVFRKRSEDPAEHQILGYFMLAVAYASSIGGLATIIGSPPNAIAVSFLREGGYADVSFAAWLRMALPLTILGCGLLYAVFAVLLRRTNIGESFQANVMDAVASMLSQQKTRMSFEKLSVLGILVVCILGWLLLAPLKMWSGLALSDASVALLGGLALFVWPVRTPSKNISSRTLLESDDLDRIPWATLFLFAGGLALSKGLQASGWVEWARLHMTGLAGVSPLLLLSSLIGSGIFLTEFMSNTALAALLVPWAVSFQSVLDFPLVNLVLALCFASSLSFMMPVATPPNAIVFGRGIIKLKTMLAIGFVLNILFLGLMTVYVAWILPYLV